MPIDSNVTAEMMGKYFESDSDNIPQEFPRK